jgi:hypothetical protein
MSPASYLAAPPRAVGGIVAPSFATATIPCVWNWLIYGALIAGFLAGATAIAFLVVRGLQTWRAFKRLRRGIARELVRLADLGEVTADKLEAATDTAEIEASVARLRGNLARLAVLRQAIDEAQDTFSRFALVMPRK